MPIGYRAKERNEEFAVEHAKVLNRFTEQFIADFCHKTKSTIGNSRIGAIVIQNYKRTPLGMNHTPEIDNIDERVAHLVFSIQDRAWQIAKRAGIPADECSLHNASIDDDLRGWCHDNPARLKAAKRAVRMIDGVWGISDLGHRITRRLLNAHPRRRGLRYDIEPRRPINVALLFGTTRQKIRNSVAV